MNRMECVHETLRHALEVLSLAAPSWLLMHTLPHWAETYERRAFDERVPRSAEKRAEWVQRVGEDGDTLLAALAAEATSDWLRQLPAIVILRRVWIQQFTICDGCIQWRSEREGIPPAARLISSPYDVDARYACKGNTTWTGYKAHLTETCDADLLRIITTVQTAAGPSLTARSWHRSTMTSETRTCFPRSTSSTRATSAPLCWWKHSATSGSTWLGLPVRTSVGSRRQARASP